MQFGEEEISCLFHKIYFAKSFRYKDETLFREEKTASRERWNFASSLLSSTETGFLFREFTSKSFISSLHATHVFVLVARITLKKTRDVEKDRASSLFCQGFSIILFLPGTK